MDSKIKRGFVHLVKNAGSLVKIDFLRATAQSNSPGGELDALHSQDTLIKINGALDIGDGYYQVIDSVDLH